MILTPELIKLRLKKLGIRTDKYLGQHFLIDEAVLALLMQTAREVIQPHDTVVEVGPGLGVLTEALITLNQPLITVERDPIFVEALADFIGNPKHLTVIKGDILQELHTNDSLRGLHNWCVIANIPYAITSPLLRKLADMPNPPHHIVVLVQKEAGERICAEAGNRHRGLLTLMLEIAYSAKIIQCIPPKAFWPAPEVESALLVLTRREKPLVAASIRRQVLRVITMGFSAKRKQIQNSLAGGLGLKASEVQQRLFAAGIDPTRRAETLTMGEWVTLAEVLDN